MLNNVVQQLLASFGASALGVLAAVWWLRSYLDRRLAFHFKELDRLSEVASTIRKERSQQSSSFLQEIQRLATLCRNELRVLVADSSLESFPRYREAVREFTDFLYASQLLTSRDTYGLLHKYKRTLEGVLIHLAVESNDDADLSDEQRSHCRTIRTLVEPMHERLQQAIKQEFDLLEKPVLVGT